MKENFSSTSRRSFLKHAFTVPAALAVAPSLMLAEDKPAAAETKPVEKPAEAKPAEKSAEPLAMLPTRKLGKTDRHVTMLNMGGMEKALSVGYIDIAWASGIRYFDTADCYMKGKSEQIFGEWLAKYPERRKDTFLVSKDHPKQSPKQLLEMIDRRLENIGAKSGEILL